MTPATLRLLAAALPLLAGGCAHPGPEARASAADRAACRARAEQVYRMQNKLDVYRADTYATSTRDSPYAGTGLGGLPNNGLDGQYSRQKMVSDCLNSTAGNVGASPAAPGPELDAPAAQ